MTKEDKVKLKALYEKQSAVKQQIKEVQKKNFTKFTDDLFSKFYKRYNKVADWLKNTVAFSHKTMFVHSSSGRRRHLIGYLVPIKQIQAAMERRAKNAPIQGFGSDLVHTAGRLFTQHIYEYLIRINEADENTETIPIRLNRMVHDSIFTSAPFHLVMATVQIIQWCCVKGVSEFYDDNYGIKFTVPLEIELEVGASCDVMYKWDWGVKPYDENLFKKDLGDDYESKYKIESYPIDYCIRKACEDYCKLYKGNADKIYNEVMDSWNDSKTKKYLDKHYPILP